MDNLTEMEKSAIEKATEKQMEVRVRVTVQTWGGSEMTYIRHYDSIEEMEQDERETGISCEILGNVWS